MPLDVNDAVIADGPGIDTMSIELCMAALTSSNPGSLTRGVPASETIATVFVCNIATQKNETDGFNALDHLNVFEKHSGIKPSHLLMNSNVIELPKDIGQVAIEPLSNLDDPNSILVYGDVVDTTMTTRHDPNKLTNTILKI